MTTTQPQPGLWILTISSAKESLHLYFDPLRRFWLWLRRSAHGPRLEKESDTRKLETWADIAAALAVFGEEEDRKIETEPPVSELQTVVQEASRLLDFNHPVERELLVGILHWMLENYREDNVAEDLLQRYRRMVDDAVRKLPDGLKSETSSWLQQLLKTDRLQSRSSTLDRTTEDDREDRYSTSEETKASGSDGEKIFLAGAKLRTIREQIGLTIRDVEVTSTLLAETHGVKEFIIDPVRLRDIETKGLVPNVFRLYVFSILYRIDLNQLLKLYGVDLSSAADDFDLVHPPKTHRVEVVTDQGSVEMPVRLDPGFDLKTTSSLGRLIENWGVVPMYYLRALAKQNYSYAYIGTDDLTMYPLLPPGSFIQVDENETRVEQGMWRSENERPIYFVETREGYVCCWCSIRRGEIVLQSHPLSPVRPRVLKHPQEAEVIGRVVGIAMRLVQQTAPATEAAVSSELREQEQSSKLSEREQKIPRGT